MTTNFPTTRTFLTWTIVLFFSLQHVKGQYESILQNGADWHFQESYSRFETGPNGVEEVVYTNYHHITLGNDTNMHGNLYTELLLNGTYSMGYLRESNDGKVFYRGKNEVSFSRCNNYKNDSIDFLLYDFNIQVNDTMKYSDASWTWDFVVTEIDSVLIQNQFRKKWTLMYEGFHTVSWIEGIGNSRMLLADLCDWDIAQPEVSDWWLICYQDDSIQWMAPTVKNCATVGIEKNTKNNFLTIYPNPIKNYVMISYSSNDAALQPSLVRVLDMIGRTVYESPIQLPTSNSGVQLELHLPEGNYLIQLIQNGQVKESQKMTVIH